MPKCALCHRNGDIRQSHILPKFAQRRIKQLAKLGGGRVISHYGGKEREVQNFCFEPLLCSECEQRLGQWENEGARFLRRSELNPQGIVADKAAVLTDLPYKPLKLFLSSLLWRMAVSQRDEFRRVELGPHETVLRRMLLTGDAGPAQAYGCSLQVVTDRIGRIPFTRPADCHRTGSECRLYRLVLDGCLITWHVGQPAALSRSSGRRWFLNENGSWTIIFQHWRRIPFLVDALKVIAKR